MTQNVAHPPCSSSSRPPPPLLLSTRTAAMAGGCATFCVIMSAVGAPLMLFFGYLCQQGSPMIQLGAKQKPEAGQGCMMAAALYAVTFVVAFMQMKSAQKSASAREVRPPAAGR
mmetsp:Transcript_68878/g.213046  ORF Transcript_68878/g.213046 Transcript_68878/m.213046 type:complete len:114 (-) Transcript_68878:50-391(-)